MNLSAPSRIQGASSPGPSVAFRRASEKFIDNLTADQKRDFPKCSLEDVRQTVEALQKKRGDEKRMRNMDRLRVFLEGMEQYRHVVQAFLNCTPFLGYVWVRYLRSFIVEFIGESYDEFSRDPSGSSYW
jgi:hypothetical protein